ncbi:MAG: hypothetical protein QOK30_481 [Nocardioidaceae bacterium]|nr:hypothetical protein [Nocardioidaceae bacterium]
MTTGLNYLAHLADESSRFMQALDTAAPDTRVPTCPDWDADDLLWHLAEVQWFWGTIVRDRLTDGARVEELKAERPAGRSALREFYERSSGELSRILAATAPDTVVWTWASDQSAGFIGRRQAHEALIHRVDAEVTAGARTPMDPALSADGVDEVLRVMYGGAPPWGDFTADASKTVRFVAADQAGRSWLATLGRFTGTSPDDGHTCDDEPDLRVAASDPGLPAAVTVTGAAADLDCELWHRPPVGPVERTGDEAVLAELDATIAAGID